MLRGEIDSVLLIEACVEVEYRGGLFYITHKVGNRALRYCMQPHTFLGCSEKARRATAEFYADQQNVIEMRRTDH